MAGSPRAGVSFNEGGVEAAPTLRAAFDEMPLGVALVRASDLTCLYVNRRFTAAAGSSDFEGKRFSEAWPAYAESFGILVQMLAETGEPWAEIQTPEDAHHISSAPCFSWRAQQLDTNPEPILMITCAESTQFVRANREREDAEQRLADEVEVTSIVLDAALALGHQTDLQGLFEALAASVQVAGEHTRVAVLQVNPGTEDLRLVAIEGEPAYPIGTVFSAASLAEPTRIALRQRLAALNDVRFLRGEQRERFENYLSLLTLVVPLVVDDQVVALICVDEPGEAREFSAKEIQLVESIVGQAGVVADNIRLLASEARAKQLLEAHAENSPLAIVEFDREFRVIRWSAEAERVFGYTSEEIMGRSIAEMRWVYEEDAELVMRESARLFSGESPRSKNVNRNYRKDGTVIWCEWYSSAIYDADGLMVSVLSQVLDVTERRKRRTAESRQHEQADVLRQVATLALSSLDPEVLAQRVVEFAQGHLGIAASVLWVPDDIGNLRHAAQKGFAEPLPSLALGSDSGVVRVYETGTTWAVGNTEADGVPEVSRRILDTLGPGPKSAVATPLERDQQVIGVLVHIWLGERDFESDELRFYELMASELALGFDNSRLYAQERARAHLSSVLRDMDEQLHASLIGGSGAGRAIEMGARALGADTAGLVVSRDGRWVVVHDYGYPESVAGYELGVNDLLVVRTLQTGGEVCAIEDVSAGSQEGADVLVEYGIRSILIVPVTVQGELQAGAYFNYMRAPHHFTPDELAFAQHMASSMALAYGNARLFAAERHIAETLQELLVVLPPEVRGISYGRAYQSATLEDGRVGGDFVDVFEIGPDLVGITIGDVSGKGVEAAGTTALIRTSLRVHALDGLGPSEACGKANDAVVRLTPVEQFATVFFGLLDVSRSQLRFTCASHTSAVLVDATGQLTQLECPGPLLGAYNGARFPERVVEMGHGTRLVLYSDGVTEARSPEGEFFGIERLLTLLRTRAPESPSAMAEDLMDEVRRFADGVLRDDVAILVVEVAPPA